MSSPNIDRLWTICNNVIRPVDIPPHLNCVSALPCKRTICDRAPKILAPIDYRIQGPSDHLAVLRRSAEGARRSRGEKKETSAVKYKTAGNHRSGRPYEHTSGCSSHSVHRLAHFCNEISMAACFYYSRRWRYNITFFCTGWQTKTG